MTFAFDTLATDGAARRGRVTTAHGTFETPAFMATATAATVKAMKADAVRATGAELAIANTYHLMLRPGSERVRAFGGLHRFMDWPGPIVTDSGGYQVMSLSKLRTLTEKGVAFRAHIDGSLHELTPERAMDIQRDLDSDIAMCLDECTPYPASREDTESSMRLSMRWAARCRTAFTPRPGYALFGIVQGGVYEDLRAESVAALDAIGFEGYGIGGLAVGEGQNVMFRVLDGLTPRLAPPRPRYLMGVGRPDDIVGAVQRGVDMFDCVMPTRSGRTGQAFTRRGTLNIRNNRHSRDTRPLEEGCACTACARHSRAYLHHLFRCGEMLGAMLLTEHNLGFYQRMMRELRTAIEGGTLQAYADAFRSEQAKGDIEAIS